MKTKEKAIRQFECIEQLLLTEGEKMAEKTYFFNIGALSELSIILSTERDNKFEYRYADCKGVVDAKRREHALETAK